MADEEIEEEKQNETEDDIEKKLPKRDYCKNNHYEKIKRRKECDYNMCDINCDNCSNRILEPVFYSDETTLNLDISDSFDLCFKCAEEKPELITEKELKKVSLNFSCMNCNFYNMVDWIPVLKDGDQSLILINKNTMEYCLCSRNMINQYGYYVISIEKLNGFLNDKGFKHGIIFDILLTMNVTLFLTY